MHRFHVWRGNKQTYYQTYNTQTHRGGKRAALTFLKQISDEVNYIKKSKKDFHTLENTFWKQTRGLYSSACVCHVIV